MLSPTRSQSRWVELEDRICEQIILSFCQFLPKNQLIRFTNHTQWTVHKLKFNLLLRPCWYHMGLELHDGEQVNIINLHEWYRCIEVQFKNRILKKSLFSRFNETLLEGLGEVCYHFNYFKSLRNYFIFVFIHVICITLSPLFRMHKKKFSIQNVIKWKLFLWYFVCLINRGDLKCWETSEKLSRESLY